MADQKITDLTNYTPPIDADVIPIVDNTTSSTKKVTWANIKATLKTYFDTLYGGANQLITSFTANDNITIGDAVGISNGADNKIVKALRFTPDDWVNHPSMTEIRDIIAVDTDTYVCCFLSPTSSLLKLVSFTVSGTTITFGNPTNIMQGSIGAISIAKLDTNKFAMSWAYTAYNYDAYYQVFTVSGTSITAQGADGVVGGTFYTTACCQLDTDKYAVFFTGSGGGGFTAVWSFSTYSRSTTGTTSTLGGNMQPNANGYGISMVKVDTDKWIVFNAYSGYAQCFSISGSTITSGSEVNLSAGSTSATAKHTKVISGSANTFWYMGKGFYGYCTVSGTTITKVSGTTIADHLSGDLFLDGTDVLMLVESSTTSLNELSVMTYSSGIVKTKKFAMTISNGKGADAVGGGQYTITGTSSYNVEGMSDNFIGIAQETVSKDASVDVLLKGVDDNQSGLVAGLKYTVLDGAFTPSETDVKGIGVSDTEILI